MSVSTSCSLPAYCSCPQSAGRLQVVQTFCNTSSRRTVCHISNFMFIMILLYLWYRKFTCGMYSSFISYLSYYQYVITNCTWFISLEWLKYLVVLSPNHLGSFGFCKKELMSPFYIYEIKVAPAFIVNCVFNLFIPFVKLRLSKCTWSDTSNDALSLLKWLVTMLVMSHEQLPTGGYHHRWQS